MEKNFYEILGIEIDAKPAEIEMAFHNLDTKYHPAVEKNLSRKEKAAKEKEFSVIKQAYDTLSNPELKYQYDLKLLTQLRQELTASSAPKTEITDETEELYTDDEADEDADENEDENNKEDDDGDMEEDGDSDTDGIEDNNNDNSANIAPDTSTAKYKEINFSINNPILKILWPNITHPLMWLAAFLLVMFCINNFKDFSHKYTLVSEVLTDTTYYTQTSEGKQEHLLKKGKRIEVLSNIADGKTLETDYGKLPKENLSAPKNDYLILWWAELYQTLFPLLLVVTLNLILLRIIAALRADYVNKQYRRSHNISLDTDNIIYCTQKVTSILRTCLVIPFAYGIMILMRNQLDAWALAYAFSAGDNALLNYILELYQEKPFLFTLTFFIMADLILGYCLISWTLNKYNCPYCHAPFSFFVVNTYDTDVNTFNKTEYRSEQRNGRTVKVPYIVAYKNYNHHVIKQCHVCAETQHKVYEKTDKI